MSISHALAQSSKISLFEELVETSIEQTRHIPQTMAKTGLQHLGYSGNILVRTKSTADLRCPTKLPGNSSENRGTESSRLRDQRFARDVEQSSKWPSW
ncbi:Sporulation protein RMD1 [Zancudomyces culisetae]|uniref:Sporulation protein RMD1 n=1 Tax=Zancudomyces culisetae TaxID=1213189 RepID=A0A1R1PNN7_ZANCU|nr:Sporulation protein RMD1 [Zancudomyces culisetae]OMH82585.1 Sporulation protein RMD1 [Zancudomyces culisetae]|eukprot:OMH80126.1 Sporulation protein RMD1 [Zancudomyces culisetae]